MAARKPKSKTEAIVMSVPAKGKPIYFIDMIESNNNNNATLSPSTTTNPKNVSMTVAMANSKNMMNGNVMDTINIDAPKAKNGCLASCFATLSIKS